MKVLVLGASGATGKLVVQNLLKKKIQVQAIIRESASFPNNLLADENIELIKGNISDFDNFKIKEMVNDCDSVICCLGHNLSFKGMFRPPYKFVSSTVKKIIDAIQSLNGNKKFILMSTTAYTNKKIGEKNTLGEKIIFALLKIFLPPHNDNMIAANYLVNKIGEKSNISWVAVRPDSLINEENVSDYEAHDQKVRGPIFDPGKTSRINVSHFMVELITNDNLWNNWNNKTPVIYNKEMKSE
jgi:nucleoside-diphosphate-sugar epimerase